MWAANLRHGVQYTRGQRQTQGLKLHERGLKAKEIAERVGVGASSVYRWTKEYREKQKQEREGEIQRLREEGMTLQEIADEVDIPLSTVARTSHISQMRKTGNEPESKAETEIEPRKAQTKEASEADLDEIPEADEVPAEETCEPDPQPETDDTSRADEEAATPDPEPEAPPPETIPDAILNTASAVMGDFIETRPDDFVARLEASPGEWMTITDNSLSNELERELLTSAAAMCLWQEWMVWYQGERTSAFTDAFGKIGDVFVRGRSGQWSLVAIAASKLREIMRRFL